MNCCKVFGHKFKATKHPAYRIAAFTKEIAREPIGIRHYCVRCKIRTGRPNPCRTMEEIMSDPGFWNYYESRTER